MVGLKLYGLGEVKAEFRSFKSAHGGIEMQNPTHTYTADGTFKSAHGGIEMYSGRYGGTTPYTCSNQPMVGLKSYKHLLGTSPGYGFKSAHGGIEIILLHLRVIQ